MEEFKERGRKGRGKGGPKLFFVSVPRCYPGPYSPSSSSSPFLPPVSKETRVYCSHQKFFPPFLQWASPGPNSKLRFFLLFSPPQHATQVFFVPRGNFFFLSPMQSPSKAPPSRPGQRRRYFWNSLGPPPYREEEKNQLFRL